MAFVVNIGYTWASINYKFTASSINIQDSETTKYETYTNYADAKGTSGQYTYNVGSVNNQLSIDYSGFTQPHDLMVKFTATYTMEHSANDFSLNFINRDNWCIDTGEIVGSANDGTSTTYYALSSSGKTFSGVMYYMGTLTGSGSLPIISGVTFYTSPNGSYNYVGDTLTVTLTPTYVKSNTANYDSENISKHSFASSLLNSGETTVYTNWLTYMESIDATTGESTLADTAIMLYNAYANNDTALAYPNDFGTLWTAKDDKGNSTFNLASQQEPTYSNTAYRYHLTSEGVRTYSAVTAGNKYYGGFGVYVIPGENLQTVSVKVGYRWQKGDVIDKSIYNNMVDVVYDSDYITEIVRTGENDSTYSSYYYCDVIDKPTYINIIDYITLTAESGYRTVLEGGYSLVITEVDIIPEEDDPTTEAVEKPSGWTESDRKTYSINNSTEQSPVLVHIKDVANSGKRYDTNLSITNHGASTLLISSFTVQAKLWHGSYDDESHTTFNESIDGYLTSTTVGTTIDASPWFDYDTNIWSVKFENNIFTFTRKNGLAYISAGYTMTLISGVTIPVQSSYNTFGENETYKYVNDLWCSFDVNINVDASDVGYSAGSYTGVEVITDGYDSAITSGSTASIYIRNNTEQNITAVNLTKFRLAYTSNTTLLPRNNLNTSTNVTYSLKNCLTNATTSNLSSTTEQTDSTTNILIRPNEKVLLYTVTPQSDAVIYTYQISVTLSSGKADNTISLSYDFDTSTTDVVNNDTVAYEFRLVTSVDLTATSTNYLINSNDFISQQVGNTYYYYYKGVVCKGQNISVLNASYPVGSTVVSIDYIAHQEGVDATTQYVASNYSTWTPPETWLTAMQAIYGEPNRTGAIVVSAN